MKTEITALGGIVLAESAQPDSKAIAKLRDWDLPRNKTELQSCLGFANYNRDFIPGTPYLLLPCRQYQAPELHFCGGGAATGFQRNQSSTNRGDGFGKTSL